MEPRSSLPDPWVDRIFDKLLLTYGAEWQRKWDGLDLAAVKADWGHELRGFQQSPHAIKFALENLPTGFAPTVLQFRDLCIKAPQYAAKALPPPTPDPAVVAAVVAAVKRPEGRDPKFWAYALREREQGGAHLSITQRAMWRAALKAEGDAA